MLRIRLPPVGPVGHNFNVEEVKQLDSISAQIFDRVLREHDRVMRYGLRSQDGQLYGRQRFCRFTNDGTLYANNPIRDAEIDFEERIADKVAYNAVVSKTAIVTDKMIETAVEAAFVEEFADC